MTWRVRKLVPPTIDDPKLLRNEGQLMEAKKEWYYKYTGGEWDGNPTSYKKALAVYKANDFLAAARRRIAGAATSTGAGGGAGGKPREAAEAPLQPTLAQCPQVARFCHAMNWSSSILWMHMTWTGLPNAPRNNHRSTLRNSNSKMIIKQDATTTGSTVSIFWRASARARPRPRAPTRAGDTGDRARTRDRW